MTISKHIENLEQYCKDDIEYRSQTAEEEKSDFDIFCDNHIADIQAVIKELKKANKIIDLMTDYLAKEDVSEEFCHTRYEPIPVECDENCKICVMKYFETKEEE